MSQVCIVILRLFVKQPPVLAVLGSTFECEHRDTYSTISIVTRASFGLVCLRAGDQAS